MILCASFLILCCFHTSFSWTTEDLELFDLVESTPQTFYQLLGVDEKASASDIRKAYRKLSTLLHPDKNKNANAEEEFRKVAAVADVLRNEEKRKTYDLILKMGLPDWKTPIYYYRRARNMGLFDLCIFLFCLATLGQYIFAWTAYWERKYEIEEVVLSKLRKRAKHQRKGTNAKKEEEIIISEVTSILQKPRWRDLFPIQLFYFIIYFIKSSPSFIASCRIYFQQRKAVPKEEEDEEEEPAPRVKSRKVVGRTKLPDYSNITEYNDTSNGTLPVSQGGGDSIHESKHWDINNLTENQILEFKKSLKKFPVGTLQRWEKVAGHLGCSVAEVIAMGKQMKNNQFSKTVALSLQGVTGTEKENRGSELYEEKDAPEKRHASDGTTNGPGDHPGKEGPPEKIWKQEEQQALEVALQKYPKDTASRWDRIAEFVSTKTKEECIERYKILVQQVKKKKGREC